MLDAREYNTTACLMAALAVAGVGCVLIGSLTLLGGGTARVASLLSNAVTKVALIYGRVIWQFAQSFVTRRLAAYVTLALMY